MQAQHMHAPAKALRWMRNAWLHWYFDRTATNNKHKTIKLNFIEFMRPQSNSSNAFDQSPRTCLKQVRQSLEAYMRVESPQTLHIYSTLILVLPLFCNRHVSLTSGSVTQNTNGLSRRWPLARLDWQIYNRNLESDVKAGWVAWRLKLLKGVLTA